MLILNLFNTLAKLGAHIKDRNTGTWEVASKNSSPVNGSPFGETNNETKFSHLKMKLT